MFRVFATSVFATLILGAASAAPDSNELQLDTYEGKVVILDFWASWCVPCRRSFPWMNEMVEKYADQGLVVIAVNLDRERADADAFLAEVPANFDILFDPDASLAREYGVEAMPNSFVFGRDGELVARHLGFKVKKLEEYESALLEALGDTP
jgi:thiol-disulfide isomerase/thioredoxin